MSDAGSEEHWLRAKRLRELRAARTIQRARRQLVDKRRSLASRAAEFMDSLSLDYGTFLRSCEEQLSASTSSAVETVTELLASGHEPAAGTDVSSKKGSRLSDHELVATLDQMQAEATSGLTAHTAAFIDTAAWRLCQRQNKGSPTKRSQRSPT